MWGTAYVARRLGRLKIGTTCQCDIIQARSNVAATLQATDLGRTASEINKATAKIKIARTIKILVVTCADHKAASRTDHRRHRAWSVLHAGYPESRFCQD
jgi:hypothetical protein